MVTASFFYLVNIGFQPNNPFTTIQDVIVVTGERLLLIFILLVIVFDFLGIRSKLPLFKKKRLLHSAIGMIIIFFLTATSVAAMETLKTPDYLKYEQQQVVEVRAREFNSNVEKLGGVNNITIEDKAKVDRLIEQYESMNEIEKSHLNNPDSLKLFRVRIIELQDQKQKQLEADAEKKAAEKVQKEAEKKAAKEAEAADKAKEEADKKAAKEAEAVKKAKEEAEKKVTQSSQTTQTPQTVNLSTIPLFQSEIASEDLRMNFIDACIQIGIEPNKIKKVMQLDDWVSGLRYSFIYEGTGLLLYTTMDMKVESIKLDLSTDLYKRGYEPYNILDYIVDESILSQLKILAEDQVTNRLNFPATANFPWLNWSCGREKDLYTVANSVTSQNAFGVKEEIPFSLTYNVKDGKAELVYFELGSTAIVNTMDSMKWPVRKKVSVDNKKVPDNESSDILLTDGEQGEYGKLVKIAGQDYIQYHLRKGTYVVKNQVNYCKIFIAKNKYYTNSDGYKESKIVRVVELSAFGQEEKITLKSDEHIKLTIHGSVILQPVD